jgi:hypothetical protein
LQRAFGVDRRMVHNSRVVLRGSRKVPTESAQQALGILRDPGLFQWYVVPLLAIVTYVYSSGINRREWNAVFAGLAFWGADWINEILNSVFFHLNGRAPLWGAPGGTAYLILIGLNIEIMFMFAIAGVVWARTLPANSATRVFGIPNRWFVAVAGSAFCVFVEILLNRIDALTWDWPWWSARQPWLIFLVGYLWFFGVAFRVHDMNEPKRQAKAVGLLWGIAAALVLVFGVWLKWI